MGKLIRRFLFVVGCVLHLGKGYAEKDESYNPAHDMSFAETHWAFISLVKPAIPVVNAGDDGTPVDAFIEQKLETKGLSLSPAADKRTLIRRLTYDLTGLPPEFEAVQAFIADESPDAYTRLVDRLLDSPAYGERWARHWLDVARYADTKGIFRRGRYSFSHTYRDYVIQAFNDDKPYDQFIMEQLAADQLDLGEDQSALAAMGFLTLGRTFFGRKDYIIDDQIDVVTRGLQGLTVTCARCHDHKSDPIPIADYYSLHGVFASSQDPEELPVIMHPEDDDAYGQFLKEKERIEGEIEAMTDKVIDEFLVQERSLAGVYLNAVDEGRHITDGEAFKVFAGSQGLQAEFLRLWIDYLSDEKNRDHPLLQEWFKEYQEGERKIGVKSYNERFAAAAKNEGVGKGDPAVVGFFREEGSPFNPSRDDVEKWIRRVIGGKVGDLMGELQALDWTHPGAPIRAHILEDIAEPKDSPIYKRGDPNRKGNDVPRQYLQVLAGSERRPFSNGSGRLDLAREIVRADNPLTARVLVNRVWGWHMGREIVDTPSDFGVRTPEPVHIDLLNWLSASFIESGWSIKWLHRQIALSRTYRQTSRVRPDAMEKDPNNTLWHHMPRARLDFESLRDTVLAVSGNLDRAMGGVQVDITNPESNRRTIYSFVDRQDMPGIFRTFDHPSPEATSPGRFETTVPQQALFLMNSPFMNLNAKRLAERVLEGSLEDDQRIRKLYQIAFQREPSEFERDAGMAFIQADQIASDDEKPPSEQWAVYGQTLLLSNELMFLD